MFPHSKASAGSFELGGVHMQARNKDCEHRETPAIDDGQPDGFVEVVQVRRQAAAAADDGLPDAQRGTHLAVDQSLGKPAQRAQHGITACSCASNVQSARASSLVISEAARLNWHRADRMQQVLGMALIASCRLC